MDTWLTPQDVAEQLQVHTGSVLRWLREGRLKGYRMIRQYRIKPADVEAFLKGAEPPPEIASPRLQSILQANQVGEDEWKVFEKQAGNWTGTFNRDECYD